MKQTLPLLLMLTLVFSCSQPNEQREILRSENERLKKTIDSLQEVQPTKSKEANYWYHASRDGKSLLQKGIKNPEEHIEDALREQPEHIPLEAVLGGTMRFGTIQVLGEKWLIADFNDGHIEGKALYEYHLKPNGEIAFKLLETVTN